MSLYLAAMFYVVINYLKSKQVRYKRKGIYLIYIGIFKHDIASEIHTDGSNRSAVNT